jgi:S-DNA-T family DNA segregation ATPase FtsK/SpoIIIE
MASERTTKKHQILGVIVLTIAVLLAICLASYSTSDTSFNAIFDKDRADNLAGRIGAHISDLLFQTFGFSAFLLALPLLVVGWKLLRGHPIHSPYMRIMGICLLTGAISTGLQMLPLPKRISNFNPGGLIGVVLQELLEPNLNRTGTAIVLISVFVLGLLAATTFSTEGFFERLSDQKDSTRPGIWRRFVAWRKSRKPVKTVVNIKAASPPPLEVTPRPTPVKPTAPVLTPEIRNALGNPTPEATRARETRQEEHPRTRKFLFPPIEFLNEPEDQVSVEEAELMERARQLQEKFAEFDVRGSITQIHPGPVVTTFEFKPDPGIKYSKITSLVEDLCLGIKAESIRIDRLPGKATVGIEVPNTQRATIMLRELIESDVFRKSSSRLALALGKLINGSSYVTDLARMPHLLIAGATGAGKSVAINCMITSILYKATPEEVRFIFIDPKRLELGIYAEIPHLLTPIVTDPKEAANALRWATGEMESRYKKLAVCGVRNIDQYNALIRSTGRQLSLLDAADEMPELEKPLPYLVIVIDELADLMMVTTREVEEAISRLAAMARAVGIHLILATQRPSVDVITGIIKANFPCRIAFKVASKVDSRTIIDSNGAELLLGNGDMLFIPPGSSRLTRIHGAYVSEKEAQQIVEHLKKQGQPTYDDSVLIYGEEELDEEGNPIDEGPEDSLYHDAVRIVVSEGRASTSLLQRRLSIGYGRAAKLIDRMHQNKIVGNAEGSKPREVLVGLDYLDRLDG